MKKVLSLLLVFVMAFALCSCETNEETSTEGQNGFAETSETVNEQRNTVDENADISSEIVYLTRTGVKYHKNGCQHLSISKMETTLGDAKAKGLKPCSRCNPPQ